jgi:hypothetical protein
VAAKKPLDVSSEPVPSSDTVLLGPTLPSGQVPFIRQQGETLSGGFARVVEDGEPVGTSEELIALERIEGDVYKAKTLYAPKGPSKVTTNAYRNGWDNIFSQTKVSQGKDLLN